VQVDHLEQAVAGRAVVAGLGPLLDVAADAERAGPGPGEDDPTDGLVRPGSLEGVDQLLDGLAPEGVEPIFPVDGDDRRGPVDLVQYVLVRRLLYN
jgi:hypothetical protein